MDAKQGRCICCFVVFFFSVISIFFVFIMNIFFLKKGPWVGPIPQGFCGLFGPVGFSHKRLFGHVGFSNPSPYGPGPNHENWANLTGLPRSINLYTFHGNLELTSFLYMQGYLDLQKLITT